ncbi:uncharacterized protein [Physcomitrium patens]|uniref:uncharacterized protein n=1 Tax=Physcomitrium patens TaxID=3218 RepID=UPI003CCDD286
MSGIPGTAGRSTCAQPRKPREGSGGSELAQKTDAITINCICRHRGAGHHGLANDLAHAIGNILFPMNLTAMHVCMLGFEAPTHWNPEPCCGRVGSAHSKLKNQVVEEGRCFGRGLGIVVTRGGGRKPWQTML